MKSERVIISVYEHQVIRLNEIVSGIKFDELRLGAMQRCFGENGVPYFSLIHNGVRFGEYVGVMQIGKMTIEVLPKADKAGGESVWRDVLVGMLKAVGLLKIHAPTSSSLRVKSNSILDLYIAIFIEETERLIHSGLIKKYRKVSDNCNSLKGNLLFQQNIQKNLVHQERFFVRHTIYDVQHHIHGLIYKTLLLLKQINTHSILHSRIGSLLLNFSEQPDLKVTETSFQKINYNRKTAPYKETIEIARLLLLNYHPNVSSGSEQVLALMFDMNSLWEQFVYVAIRDHIKKTNKAFNVTAQTSKYFWKPQNGNYSSMKPDIVINHKKLGCVVLDTKWKVLNNYNPSPDDLRQLYVYHEFFDAKRVALVYPNSVKVSKGFYFTKYSEQSDKECSVMGIQVETNINLWKLNITKAVLNWIGEE